MILLVGREHSDWPGDRFAIVKHVRLHPLTTTQILIVRLGRADLWKDRRVIKLPLIALCVALLALLNVETFVTANGAWDHSFSRCIRSTMPTTSHRILTLVTLFLSTSHAVNHAPQPLLINSLCTIAMGLQLVALCLAAVPIIRKSCSISMSGVYTVFIVNGWLWYWIAFCINAMSAVRPVPPIALNSSLTSSYRLFTYRVPVVSRLIQPSDLSYTLANGMWANSQLS